LIKIVLRKSTNAIFLAIVLIAGTFAAISPSFMVGAHAQQYGMNQKYNSYEPDYGMDNSYDDKQSYGKDSNSYDKSKDSSNVKCNNINVNVNGDIDIGASQVLGALATDEAQASADEGEIGTNSVGSDGGRPSGSDNDPRFVCINNNNNVVVEEPTTAVLKVTKQIDCKDQIEGDCDDLRELVNDDFIIQVEGNNPDPSSPFPGSPTGTDVTLGPGDYVVSETSDETLAEDLQTFADNHPGRTIVSFSPSFTGDCTGTDFSDATGTIAAGESQSCNVINAFSILSIP
jgi:hypothetical protein